MIILYSNKFESVLYAVLLSNLTGLAVMPMAVAGTRPDADEYIHIDALDWKQIYADHTLKFGPIPWIETVGSTYEQVRANVQTLLDSRSLDEYITGVERIKRFLKYGMATVHA